MLCRLSFRPPPRGMHREWGYNPTKIPEKHKVSNNSFIIPLDPESIPIPTTSRRNPSFSITISSAQYQTNSCAKPGVAPLTKVWLASENVNAEDQNLFMVVVGDPHGYVNDHLVLDCFACETYADDSTKHVNCRTGMLRVDRSLVWPGLAITPPSMSPSLEYQFSEGWKHIRPRLRMNYTLAFPPRYADPETIRYKEVRNTAIFVQEVIDWMESEGKFAGWQSQARLREKIRQDHVQAGHHSVQEITHIVRDTERVLGQG